MEKSTASGDCPFCQNNQPVTKENRHSYSTLNYSPASPGHFLVIPKEHYTNLAEIPGSVHEDMMLTLEETYGLIKSRIEQKSSFLAEYYDGLLKNPPFLYSREYSDENLTYIRIILRQCRDLKPPIGYNVGLNMNEGAGQRAAHIHYHVFPRYREGLGVVNAMRGFILDYSD